MCSQRTKSNRLLSTLKTEVLHISVCLVLVVAFDLNSSMLQFYVYDKRIMTAFTSPGLEKINSLMSAKHLGISHQHHRNVHKEMNSCVFRAGFECNAVNKN